MTDKQNERAGEAPEEPPSYIPGGMLLPSDAISLGVLRERFPGISNSAETRRVVFQKVESLMSAELSYLSAARLSRADPPPARFIDVPRYREELARALADLHTPPDAVDHILGTFADRIRQEPPRRSRR